MSDNKKIIKPEDATKINLNQIYEVKYWTGKLDCTETQLKRAVDKVGVKTIDVKKYLKK